MPARPGPTVERFMLLQWVRSAAVVLVLLCVELVPSAVAPHPQRVVVTTLCFTALAATAGVTVSRRPRWVRPILLGMLGVDALWLSVCLHVTGGAASPVHYALLLQVAAITLLYAPRTGLGIAALVSAELVLIRVAVGMGWLAETAEPGPAGPNVQLALLLVVLWVVAAAAATASSLNRRELFRRARDLQALALLTERVERSATPATVARTLLDGVGSSYGLRRAVLLASREGTLALLASYGEDVGRDGRPGPSAVIADAQGRGETTLVRGLDRVQDAWLTELLPDADSLIVVPLFADGRPIGALVAEHTGRTGHRRRMIAPLERSAVYGALALRNAWLMESVQRLAATDSLTKIANRRSFELTLERELARATRSAEYVSLVMVDIDHFKVLNDTHGHQAGDDALRNVAAALAMTCREFDTPARYGGEEFMVILPGCDAGQAYEIAERLRRAVGTAPSPVALTASAGVATYPAHAGDAEQLVRAADEALYTSKRAGRDRTSVAIGAPPEEQMQALIRRAVRERVHAKQGRTDEEALHHLFEQ